MGDVFLGRARFFDDGDAVVALTLKWIALFQEVGQPVGTARGLVNLAVQATLRSDLESAQQYLNEALTIAEQTAQDDLRGQIVGELGGVTLRPRRPRHRTDAARGSHRPATRCRRSMGTSRAS